MKYDAEKAKENRLADISEVAKLTLYGGYVFTTLDSAIRAEVYKRGRGYYCFLWDGVCPGQCGWFRSDKCYSPENAVADALHKAGYSFDDDVPSPPWWDNEGRMCLEHIGKSLGVPYRIISIGRLI